MQVVNRIGKEYSRQIKLDVLKSKWERKKSQEDANKFNQIRKENRKRSGLEGICD